MSMSLKKCVLVSLVVPFLLSSIGCVTMRKYSITQPAPPTINSNDYTPEKYAEDVKAYECAVRPSQSNCGAQSSNPLPQPNPELAAQTRNNIVYSLMGAIDDVYGQYTVRLYAGKGVQAVGLDAITLGLSSAATIATHTETKTILSALGTGISGLGLSIDKNFFAQQTFQVIAIAMQTRRDKLRRSIAANLKLDTTVYPLSAAKTDLVNYYYAGTLSGGLQELQEESGTAAANAANGGKPATETSTTSQTTTTPAPAAATSPATPPTPPAATAPPASATPPATTTPTPPAATTNQPATTTIQPQRAEPVPRPH